MGKDKTPVVEEKQDQQTTDDVSPEQDSGGSDEQQTEISKLQEQLAAANKKAEENWSEMLRARAELENAHKRGARDVENAHKYAIEKFVQELLPVIDSMEMGLSAAADQSADIEKLRQGTELTLKIFTDALQKFEIESVDPVDQAFDPEFHQAMTLQETDDKSPNTVLAVMQKGYLLKGRLIRPAMVVVSKAPSAAKPKAEIESGEDTERVGTNVDEKA
jgi:molecular chaperone GrpE